MPQTPKGNFLTADFFERDAQVVARDLLGKIVRHAYKGLWLSARIIETEAYYCHEKASHSSLGYSRSRKALFMPAGTIYMYYARGGDSLNVSCEGEGNAVLIKSAIPFFEENNNTAMLSCMQSLNPHKNGSMRSPQKLCAGQTLLCKSLSLKVPEWREKTFDPKKLRIDDVGIVLEKGVIQATRLGIPAGRDEHLLYRFICREHVNFCTKKPPEN